MKKLLLLLCAAGLATCSPLPAQTVTKITELPSAGSLLSTDVFPVVIDPSGTKTTKKATLGQMLTLAGGTYLSQSAAASTYLTQSSAASSYLTKTGNGSSLTGLTSSQITDLSSAVVRGAIQFLDVGTGTSVLDYNSGGAGWTIGDASGFRSALGVVIGTDVQPYNATLADIAGLSLSQGDLLWYDGGHLKRLAAPDDTSAVLHLSPGFFGGPKFIGWGAGSVTINGTEIPLGASADLSLATDHVTFTGGGKVLTSPGISTSGAGTEMSLSDLLDWFSTTRNAVLFRNAGGWTALAPGTSGQVLTSNGSSADLSWTTPSSYTFSTGLTNTAGTITVNTTQNITQLSGLTSNGFVKTGGGDGTLSVDTSTYLTGLTVGTTAITSGTNGRYLYDNAGVVGERTAAQVLSDIGAQAAGSYAVLSVNTFTGAQVLSVAGTASTPGLTLTGAPYTAGSATTNFPQCFLQPSSGVTASTTWSTGGTYLGINAADAFTGNLFDFKRAGVTFAKLSYQGRLGSLEAVIVGASGYQGYTTLANASSELISARTVLLGDVSTGLRMSSGYGIAWSSSAAGSGDAYSNLDTGLARSSAGVVKFTNGSSGSGAPKLSSYTVSQLPSASTVGVGVMAFVTDATATTAYTTVSGGGSNKVLVVSDGTNWIIH